jgi:hypothetical protein
MRNKKFFTKNKKYPIAVGIVFRMPVDIFLQVSIVVLKIYWKLETECRLRAVLEAASLASVASTA